MDWASFWLLIQNPDSSSAFSLLHKNKLMFPLFMDSFNKTCRCDFAEFAKNAATEELVAWTLDSGATSKGNFQKWSVCVFVWGIFVKSKSTESSNPPSNRWTKRPFALKCESTCPSHFPQKPFFIICFPGRASGSGKRAIKIEIECVLADYYWGNGK